VAAAEYHRRAAALTTAMNSHLLDPATGLYADGLTADGTRIPNFSQHAQSFPVAYGVAPSPERLAGYIGGLGMRQGPMTLRQLLSAVPPETVLRLLTDASGEGPAQVLAEGGTFLWEQWRPGCPVAPCHGTQVDQTSSESMSHGWGAAGISAIIQSLLGLRIGAETLTIAPPASGLDHARGTVWTQRGPVTVAWRRTGERFALDVTLPVNVTAMVVLPSGDEFTAGSGRSHFTS
jgi:alpha-L-rhamnosidase-like protein